MAKRMLANRNKHAPSQDFFALGASSTSAPGPSNLSQSLSKLPGKRNEVPFQAPGMLAAKRPKLNSPLHQASPSMPTSPAIVAMSSSGMIKSPSVTSHSVKPPTERWEERAMMVPANELIDRVFKYDNQNAEEMIERVLCGGAKQLLEQKSKPDGVLLFSLFYLAKVRPLFFISPIIVESFSSLLKREALVHFVKSKQCHTPVAIINIFYQAFHDENNWPEVFMRMFIEDSLGDRVWVDHPQCQDFVDILVASFKTKLPLKSQLQASDMLNPSMSSKHTESSASSSSSSLVVSLVEDNTGDDASCSSNPSIYSDHGNSVEATSRDGPITSRYLENEQFVVKYVTDTITEHFNRRQSMGDISRNLLKLLTATAGFASVRLMVASKLDQWFQNPKLSRPAQDLLLTVCLNCNEKDVETVAYLMKVKLKNKAFVNHFCQCLKELLNQKDGTFEIVSRTVLKNDLARNPQLVALIFQHTPDRATLVLAQVVVEMIYSKEDFCRSIRSMLREIIQRFLRFEFINYQIFVETLLNESTVFAHKVEFTQLEQELKDRALFTIIDLITMIQFLLFYPILRESFAQIRTDKRDIFRNIVMQISTIRHKMVLWLCKTGVPFYTNDQHLFTYCFKKAIMTLDLSEYHKLDNWPPEADRFNLFKLCTEVPLMEGTFLTICGMGLAKEFPLAQHDACHSNTILIQRAASNYDGDSKYPMFLFQNYHLVLKHMFDCCIYVVPDNTPKKLPDTYEMPKLADVMYYWNAWIQMVILAAHLPHNFGKPAWAQLPTVQMLIEMAITNNFQYPPKSNEELLNFEIKMVQKEKTILLDLERCLSGITDLNESSSQLINQLVLFDLTSPPRRPPNKMIEEFIKACHHFKLCHHLCQSRDPDFLLTIIEQQQRNLGPQAFLTPMPWLVELVEASADNALPVQCLCEFLLGQISEEFTNRTDNTVFVEVSKGEKNKKKNIEKRRKQLRLMIYLQKIAQHPDQQQAEQMLDYLLGRLYAPQATIRILAYKALYMISATEVAESWASLDENNVPPLLGKEEFLWMKTKLSSFVNQKEKVQQALQNALLIETNPVMVMEYLAFLSHTCPQPDDRLIQALVSMILQHRSITDYMYNHMNDLSQEVYFHSIYQIFTLYFQQNPRGSLHRHHPNKEFVVVFNNTSSTSSSKSLSIQMSLESLNALVYILSYHKPSFYPVSQMNPIVELFMQETSQPTAHFNLDPTAATATTSQGVHFPDYIVSRVLCSDKQPLIGMVLNNQNVNDFVRYLCFCGISTKAKQIILTKLDKWTDSKLALVLEPLDRAKLLRRLRIFWQMDIDRKLGLKFATTHLEYKPSQSTLKSCSDTDEEMEDKSVSSKKDKSTEIVAVDAPFKKDDLQKLFQEQDTSRLISLSRHIAVELGDKNAKTKKITRLFLTEFAANISKVDKLIVEDAFTSIMNIITMAIFKDAKLTTLNSELKSIKQSLASLKLTDQKKPIQKTVLWKCLERVSKNESSTKSKKLSKPASKKKTANSLKSADDLEKLLRTCALPGSDIALSNDYWGETVKDLSVEKFYYRDTELLTPSFKSVVFSRDRPYFLSLLLHKSNFVTLNSCIEYALSGQNEQDHQQLNASSVLDFLTICINSPKLSIGREVDEPKSVKYEDVLQLNNRQIEQLIKFVIVENDVAKRVDLVLKSCCTSNNKIKFVSRLLARVTDEKEQMIASELLTRIYLHIPNINLPEKLDEQHLMLIQSEPSFVDRITHNLITSFMYVEPNSSPVNAQMVRFWELAIVKLASTHPLLVIRQLPMIPALLSGKATLLRYEVFRNMNLVNIFHKFLNILRLLRPHLWAKRTRGLTEILDLYMEFFMSYYQQGARQKEYNNELLPLLVKFLALLDDWLKHDSESASNWIKENKHSLTELSHAFHSEQHTIRSIIAGLPLHNQTQFIAQNCHQSLEKLRSNMYKPDMLTVTLTEVSKQANHTPEIAVYILDELLRHYKSSSTCELALNLTLKALHHNPSLSKTIVSTYLQCFSSQYAHVTNAALNILPEFVILSQEYRHLLMSKAFELAIGGNPNAAQALSDAFKALKSQIGC